MHIKAQYWLALILLATGMVQIGGGAWIYAKAQLAQYLISRAWRQTLVRHAPVKPWPWADTWPVAQLRWKDRVDLYVLAGINGASLPFGPGMEGGVRNKSILIAGHRDTHFAFLARMRTGDRLTLTGMNGHRRLYRVTSRKVLDIRRVTLDAGTGARELILVTCYPFHALRAGGPLRMVVIAVPVTRQETGAAPYAPFRVAQGQSR